MITEEELTDANVGDRFSPTGPPFAYRQLKDCVYVEVGAVYPNGVAMVPYRYHDYEDDGVPYADTDDTFLVLYNASFPFRSNVNPYVPDSPKTGELWIRRDSLRTEEEDLHYPEVEILYATDDWVVYGTYPVMTRRTAAQHARTTDSFLSKYRKERDA